MSEGQARDGERAHAVEAVPLRPAEQPAASGDAASSLVSATALFHRLTRGDNAQARVLAERALARDPELYPAHLLVAWTHLMDRIMPWGASGADSVGQAIAHADRAAALAPGQAQTHRLRARLHLVRGDYEAASAEQGRALALAPDEGNVIYSQGVVLTYLGDPGQAIGWIERALLRDPRSPWHCRIFLALSTFLSGEARKALAITAREDAPSIFPCLVAAASAARAGRAAEAAEQARRVLAINPAFSLSRYAEALALRRAEHRAAYIGALRQAGLPD